MRPDAEEILRLVLSRLDDMKAEDTLTIDLRDKSSIGDYMVVASGRSNQHHVGSVADRVVEDLHKVGIAVRVEGVPHCDWVVIDAGDVIVHVFRPEVRAFYNSKRCGWPAGRRSARANPLASVRANVVVARKQAMVLCAFASWACHIMRLLSPQLAG